MYNQDTRATKYDMSMSGTKGKSDKKSKCKYSYEMNSDMYVKRYAPGE